MKLIFLSPKRKKSSFKECPIAGWYYHLEPEFFNELTEGTELALIRERKNTNDPYAVAVALANDYDGDPNQFDFDAILGYVPRTENQDIAQMLDMGWTDIFTAQLTTVKDHGPYIDRLRMTIYIQQKETPVYSDSRMKCIHAMLLDEDAIHKLQRDLYNKGCSYFRWGGFPPWEKDLPEEGENVFFLHRRETDAAIYLVHVIAIGEHAAPFLENPEEELTMTDDCIPYIVTNVMGPLIYSLDKLEFLEIEAITKWQPDIRLSAEATIQLENLIQSSI